MGKIHLVWGEYMKLLKTHYLCPFCFTKNRIDSVKFRCQSKPPKCLPELDSVLEEYHGIRDKVPVAFSSGASSKSKLLSMPVEATCPNCQGTSKKRLCSNCHYELPYTIAEHNDLIISVIGGKDAGKSHYIAVLIQQIKKQLAPLYQCNLQPLSDTTMKQYNERFRDPIYHRQETIAGTVSARTSSDVKAPLIYSLTFEEKKRFRKNKSISVTLVFFDTAGEDLNEEDIMTTENKYIYNSSGIILLLDPLQLDNVRHQIPDTDLLPEKTTEVDEIIDRTNLLIKKAHQLKMHQKIKIPIAVSFSKIDTLFAEQHTASGDDLIESGSPLHPRYSNKHLEEPLFNLQELQTVHDEVEGLLDYWECAYIKQKLESFEDYAFFGLTALGAPPEGRTKIKKVRPYRVEDPFLWLLWKNNVIKARK